MKGERHGTRLERQFFKMTGSGNDFVFFDARDGGVAGADEPERIRALCGRGTGIGADGVVLLETESAPGIDFGIRYFNADGALAELCGNASLCSVALARRLGIGEGELRFRTGSGVLTGRLDGGMPEIDIGVVRDLEPEVGVACADGEHRIGFARVGVPHLVIRCDDVERVDVAGRGRTLRWTPTLPEGANANFVSGSAGHWRIRTFERGVEGETLACGTGAVATAAVLRAWALDGDDVALETRSGKTLRVRLREESGAIQARLRGEGRLVFTGILPSEG